MKLNENTQAHLTPLQAAALRQKFMEAEIILRAWSDEDFRSQLESDPAKTLTAAGIPLPEGKSIRVIHEEPDTIHITLPPQPAISEEASDEELDSVAGGGLIENGKCQHYENAKNRNSDYGDKFLAGFALSCGAIFGVSWGYG